MFDATVCTIGSIANASIRSACDDYVKRMRPFARLRVVELQSTSFTSMSQVAAQRDEADSIIAFCEKQKDATIILLHETGKSYTSVAFSKMIDQVARPLVFVLGGPLGFDSSILEQYPSHITLSAFTFTHDIARLVLLEQLYRAGTIIAGKQYHY